MIGGIKNFGYCSKPIQVSGHNESPRVCKVLELVKQHGYISLVELSRKMRLSHDQTLNAVQNASLVEGSRIYEDVVNHRIYLGWL